MWLTTVVAAPVVVVRIRRFLPARPEALAIGRQVMPTLVGALAHRYKSCREQIGRSISLVLSAAWAPRAGSLALWCVPCAGLCFPPLGCGAHRPCRAVGVRVGRRNELPPELGDHDAHAAWTREVVAACLAATRPVSDASSGDGSAGGVSPQQRAVNCTVETAMFWMVRLAPRGSVAPPHTPSHVLLAVSGPLGQVQ